MPKTPEAPNEKPFDVIKEVVDRRAFLMRTGALLGIFATAKGAIDATNAASNARMDSELADLSKDAASKKKYSERAEKSTTDTILGLNVFLLGGALLVKVLDMFHYDSQVPPIVNNFAREDIVLTRETPKEMEKILSKDSRRAFILGKMGIRELGKFPTPRMVEREN